ncbi:MAG: FtsX-like permease family protein [Parachlamydia sp.]|nr:FtsX-like permease family protein [Parachlamydia sp.]
MYDTRAQTALRLFLHNRPASAGAILGVIAIVFLVGIQLAILFGVIEIISNEITHSGADYWVVTPKTTNLDFSNQLPVSYIDRITALKEIDYARPYLNTTGLVRNRDGRYELAITTGVKVPQMTGGPWTFVKGSPASLLDPFGFTMDNTTLEDKETPLFGQLVDVQNRLFRLTAITKHIRCFRGNVGYMSEANARRLFHLNPAFCNAIMVKFKTGALTGANRQNQLQALFPYAKVMTNREIAGQTVRYYLFATGIGGSIFMSAGLSAGIGLVIIGLTLYNNILSYERDIAILRVLGARRKDIFLILLYQVLIVSTIGLLIGFFFLAITLQLTFATRIPVNLPFWFGPVHVCSTILLCLVGSLFAMRHALKIDPATVFR